MAWITRARRTALRLMHRRRWSALDLALVTERFGTPERIHDFMQVCFEYVHDEDHHGVPEHWQLPHRTLLAKRGDCEDWALFARHVLRANGYEARILAAFTVDDGHAVCVVRDRRRWLTLCNQGLVRLDLRARRYCRRDRTRVARHVADHLFPDLWVTCSWVGNLAYRSSAEDLEEHLVPHYEWIHPVPGPGQAGRR